MKDNSMTVKGEDLHTSNKAIHLAHWKPVNGLGRQQHNIFCDNFCPDVHHQLSMSSAWGTSCTCIYLVLSLWQQQPEYLDNHCSQSRVHKTIKFEPKFFLGANFLTIFTDIPALAKIKNWTKMEINDIITCIHRVPMWTRWFCTVCLPSKWLL